MMRRFSLLFFLLTWCGGVAAAQTFPVWAIDASRATLPADGGAARASVPDLPSATALPRMAPELALQVYHGRTVLQSQDLAAYSAITVVRAQLPETRQQGEIEVQRHFA